MKPPLELEASQGNQNNQDFSKSLNVSRETIEHLERYRALLHKWQRAINLVSPSTLPESWQRHFVDSAQIVPLIPKGTKTVADLGSGAGFPGLVLAILRPDLKVHLVESDARKCEFLRNVSRETLSKPHIHTARIESVYEAIAPDIITARALAALPELLKLCLPWALRNPALEMIFLKGAQAEKELEEALQLYAFSYELYPSDTDPQGKIVKISGLKAL
ncbi:MAG: 16S rRNA (guanine(527)-N(7))-methyltransferase RsmG [Alphaproteobacteria bacterium]